MWEFVHQPCIKKRHRLSLVHLINLINDLQCSGGVLYVGTSVAGLLVLLYFPLDFGSLTVLLSRKGIPRTITLALALVGPAAHFA